MSRTLLIGNLDETLTSFRYKMPKMILKQESRLNGVKTNIFNLNDIAGEMRVPPEGRSLSICDLWFSHHEVLVC